MRRLCDGRTFKQIAIDRRSCGSTVRQHAQSAYRRLGAIGMVEAMAMMRQRGWLGEVELEEETPLSISHPFLAIYLRRFDPWLKSGQTDQQARATMDTALLAARIEAKRHATLASSNSASIASSADGPEP